uniref:Yippee domain-containing protein n=1 Tax=Globodera pallida TaxID=36090 RepID=A0A183CAM4_GLOPA
MSFKSPIGGDEFGKIPARFYESPHSFRQLLLNSRNHFEDGTTSETLLIDTLQKAFPGYSIETGFEAVTHGVESRFMITGQHMVRDVFCKTCNFKLGWMYEFAHEPQQQPRYFGAKTARRTRGNGPRTCGAEPTTNAYFLVIFCEQQWDQFRYNHLKSDGTPRMNIRIPPELSNSRI